jgi:hypothetical protein
LGIHWSCWTEIVDLVEKQQMAVKILLDVNCVALISQKKYTAPLPALSIVLLHLKLQLFKSRPLPPQQLCSFFHWLHFPPVCGLYNPIGNWPNTWK